MAETVRITVVAGPHQGRRFCFRGADEVLVGRSADCLVHLGGAGGDKSISRRHCRLVIDPPLVTVQDLGSRNGTFINAQPVATAGGEVPMGNLRHGDMLTIGGTSCLVEIVDCPPSDLPPEYEPVWKAGDIVRSDCPVPCTADVCAPFLGCCVGGHSVPRTT